MPNPQEKKHQPHEYQLIRRWHRSTGSYDYYIKRIQQDASEEFAPLNSIYQRDDGSWVTVDELEPGHWFLRLMAEEDNPPKEDSDETKT